MGPISCARSQLESSKTNALAVLGAGAAPILPHFHEMAAGSGTAPVI
jgi:hypothetical protein